MPRAAIAQQVNTQQRLAPRPISVKDALQIPTHLRQVTRRSTALATLARQAQTADRVHSVWWANTRLRQDLQRAATVQQVNIQWWLVPHPMCVKDARQTPTDLRRATKKSTALATLAQRAQTADRVHSVWRANTRLSQEKPRAATAQQVNIQRRLVPHLMCVKSVRQTPTDLRRATRMSTALATLAQRAQAVDRV